ncbi:universal stress protein [bacterium]|nr:universal stress protein [bacterium]
MKKVLLALDGSKGSKAAIDCFVELLSCAKLDEVLLMYVERYAGSSFMDDMVTDAEMTTLNEVLTGTEYKEALDKRAASIIEAHKVILEGKGVKTIKTVIKSGHPAEEILKTAKDENADMIFIGSKGNRHHSVIMGSVSREIVNRSDIPVFIAKVK